MNLAIGYTMWETCFNLYINQHIGNNEQCNQQINQINNLESSSQMQRLLWSKSIATNLAL